MTGGALDRRDRAGALVGLTVLAAFLALLLVGVDPDIGNRMVPPLLGGLTIALVLSRHRLRLLVAVIGAGVPSGLALGAGLRLSMLVAALMDGGVERSLNGTVGMIVFGAVPGTIVSATVALARRLMRLRPAAVTVISLLLGAAALLGPADVRAEMAARGVLAVNLVSFLGTFALFGWLVITLQQRIEARWHAVHTGATPASAPSV